MYYKWLPATRNAVDYDPNETGSAWKTEKMSSEPKGVCLSYHVCVKIWRQILSIHFQHTHTSIKIMLW